MRRTLSLLAALAAFTAPVFGHHGFGTFDLSQEEVREGALTQIRMINPHSWIYFDVTTADGTVEPHRCEMRSAHVLRRSGWSEDLFPIGQHVVLEVAPDRADPQSCYLLTIRFEDGSTMDRYGQYVQAPDGNLVPVRGAIALPDTSRHALRRPNGVPNISGDWAPEQVVMVDPRGQGGGLVPLSQLPEFDSGEREVPTFGGGRGRGGSGPRTYNGTTLTPRGEREAAAFERTDNPRFSCETTSILFDWTFDGPVNRIIQTSDTVVISYGQMNLKRTIHLDLTEHPDDIAPSRAGHSIGRWEGDTLVVDTVGFLPGVLNAPVRHSDQLHVVERFLLDPESVILTREYVATDPVYLTGEYTGSDRIQLADAPYARDNCDDVGFLTLEEEQSRDR